MNRRLLRILSALPLLAAPALARTQGSTCAPDNAGLKLPPGFCATIFVDSIRGARHLAVAPNGDVFVSMQGRAGGGVLALRELNHSGHADTRQQFASGFNSSEVALFEGYLYTEALVPSPQRGGAGNAPPAGPMPTVAIVRYPLKSGELMPSGPPDTIVDALPGPPGHTTRNFAITRDGVLYLNIGSATNTCQARDRTPRLPGVDPCVELEARAGVWKFDARKQHQTPSATNHLARGIRNAVGVAISPLDGRLWTTQHGRDDLASWFPKLGMDSAAAIKYNAENPAEELMQVNQNEDFGWPYCYYSVEEHHLVLAPEYGGDGKKLGDCARKKEPVATFPGHWAPNALFFYTGSMFPARYKNGAFIAFHGSWNRAPEPAGGYNVVFQPLSGGKAAGTYEVFADAFSNATTGAPTGGNHRPTGLAQSPDGALYVADDAGGRIYKIVYTGK